MVRKRSAMNLYHVMVRGVDKNMLFSEEDDNKKYLEYLSKAAKNKALSIYAVCLMGNHAHLLLGINTENDEITIDAMSRFMYEANVAYARYYNRKYERSGPVFGDRYKSVPIFSGKQFMNTWRYIYYNPVEAGLSDGVVGYTWSSYGQKEFYEIAITDPIAFEKGFDYDNFIKQKPEPGERYLEPKVILSDEKAAKLLKEKENLKNSLDIAYLPEEKQIEILKWAWGKGISIRRLARITGLSIGIIGRRLKKERII